GANSYTDGVATITTGITKSYDPGSTSRDVTNLFAGNGQSFNNRSFSGRVQYAPAPVPEPFSIATLGIGLVGFVARRRRSR
ncbi:PEP-CTERM sorting domain-containing protein, partial [bacterium]